METIAIYWEPEARTYGFVEKEGLFLHHLLLSYDHLARWGRGLREEEASGGGLLMAVATTLGADGMHWSLLFDRPDGECHRRWLEKTMGRDPVPSVRIEGPVTMIWFQGPHFGDRYGIADGAFGALAENNVRVAAAGCTGAGLTIVVADDDARAAVAALSNRFNVPRSSGAKP